MHFFCTFNSILSILDDFHTAVVEVCFVVLFIGQDAQTVLPLGLKYIYEFLWGLQRLHQ